MTNKTATLGGKCSDKIWTLMIVSFPGNTETYSIEEGLPPFLGIFFKRFFQEKYFLSIKFRIQELTCTTLTGFSWWVEWALWCEKELQKVIRNQYLNE